MPLDIPYGVILSAYISTIESLSAESFFYVVLVVQQMCSKYSKEQCLEVEIL